jgi:hypothetical protein
MHAIDEVEPYDSFSRRLKNALAQASGSDHAHSGGLDDDPGDSLAGRLEDALRPRHIPVGMDPDFYETFAGGSCTD